MSRASQPGHPRPTAVIVIAHDELSAEVVIEGNRQAVTGRVPKETRRAALDAATGYAARIGQPVLVDARDSNGYWQLVALPDGVVQAADQSAPAPEPVLPPRPVTTDGSRGRSLLIAAAGVLALTLVAGAGVLTVRSLPSSSADADAETPETTALDHPAPPGFEGAVEFQEDVAPESSPGISRDGELLSYIGPEDRIHLTDTSGEQLWAADLPVEAGELLDAPQFVDYGGETAIVVETAETLWFWSVSGGASSSVDLPEDASPQYVGTSVLVRSDEEAFVPVDGELAEVELPGSSGAMLADGERVLAAVVTGPWNWVDPDGDDREVGAERPDAAGEMDGIVTALREYVVITWESPDNDDVFLAFHDHDDGTVAGGTEVAPDELEEARHRSGPVGTRMVAYGPVVLDTETGDAVVVPGLDPQIAVGDRVFGEIDGGLVAVGADGEPVAAPSGAEAPEGLLGDNAVVVHDDQLYVIPPE